MRSTVLAMLTLAAAATPAGAEDFTGFYAGVNAGYISERGERSGNATIIPPGASDTGAGLPPSALDAADRMTGRDGRTQSRGASRR